MPHRAPLMAVVDDFRRLRTPLPPPFASALTTRCAWSDPTSPDGRREAIIHHEGLVVVLDDPSPTATAALGAQLGCVLRLVDCQDERTRLPVAELTDP